MWRSGSARLLDYGAALRDPHAPLALFVPSLINRYYILDLEPERSLLRWLTGQGVHALALDWGDPGPLEASFNCADYVTGILAPAIAFLHAATGRRVALAGYCMGGVLALAAAQLYADRVSRLVLMATPWNFHIPDFQSFLMDRAYLDALDALLGAEPSLSAEIVQSFFYFVDPWVFEQKFHRFATLSQHSKEAREFVALERWVNDGVAMTAEVARDCLIRWMQRNALANEEWTVSGHAIRPGGIAHPCLAAIPQNDRIVPLQCALPLTHALKNATRIHPGSGHVGMVVGRKAKKELWQPLAEFLRAAP